MNTSYHLTEIQTVKATQTKKKKSEQDREPDRYLRERTYRMKENRV